MHQRIHQHKLVRHPVVLTRSLRAAAAARLAPALAPPRESDVMPNSIMFSNTHRVAATTSSKASICALMDGSLSPASNDGIPSSKGTRAAMSGWNGMEFLSWCLLLAAGVDEDADLHGGDVFVGKDLKSFVPVEETSFA